MFLFLPFLRGRRKCDQGIQTDPEMVNTRVQTETFHYPIKVKNKPLKPRRLLKDKSRYHSDWFARRFYCKNKIFIFNKSEYEIDAYVTPRNLLNTIGIRGIGGEFNNDYEEEHVRISPGKRIKLRNFATHRYYLKLFINDIKVSQRLCSCADDIIIS